ncbi:cysteine dioxygenase [Roseomonas sp. BN140053]|uniref:cysteine dioxygenase family protein n=1 Tax=Roseomonas sp. BN140053 TaxID=3391898 RepID=UPI0039E7CB15
MEASELMASRLFAIRRTMAEVRGIEARQGVTRDGLDAIRAALLALAGQRGLFPADEFPPPPPGRPGGRRHRLQRDVGGRFALDLHVLNPGTETAPHDHGTWAVVVAVEGQVLNRLYDPVEPPGHTAPAPLRLRGEVAVEPGRGLALLPDEVHSIHVAGPGPARHLHLYGVALEQQRRRRSFGQDAQAAGQRGIGR